MYFSDQYQFSYIRNPRTMSTSTARWLLRHYGAQVYTPPQDQIDVYRQRHQRCIPDRFVGYYTWSVVRCPYDRLFSVWKQARFSRDCKWWGGVVRREQWSFPHFVEWMCDVTIAPSLPRFGSQVAFFEGVRIDKMLRFDDMPHALKCLPFYKDGTIEHFPSARKDMPTTAGPEDEWSPRLLAMVGGLVGPDIEAYGYEWRH